MRRLLDIGSEITAASRVIPKKSVKQTSRPRREIYKIVSHDSSRYQISLAVLRNLAGKIEDIEDGWPSHEKERYPTINSEETA